MRIDAIEGGSQSVDGPAHESITQPSSHGRRQRHHRVHAEPGVPVVFGRCQDDAPGCRQARPGIRVLRSNAGNCYSVQVCSRSRLTLKAIRFNFITFCSVKPAIFDLVLTFTIAIYLSAVYFGVQVKR